MSEDVLFDIRIFRPPKYYLNLGIHIDLDSKNIVLFLPILSIIVGYYDSSFPTWSFRNWFRSLF